MTDIEQIEQYRAGFEAWAVDEDFDLRWNDDGSYANFATALAWQGYAAAKRESGSGSGTSTSQAAAPVLIGHISGYDIDRAAKGDALYVSTALLPEPNPAFRSVPVYRINGAGGRQFWRGTGRCTGCGALSVHRRARFGARRWQRLHDHMFVPVDAEDMGCGIDEAIAASTKPGDA